MHIEEIQNTKHTINYTDLACGEWFLLNEVLYRKETEDKAIDLKFNGPTSFCGDEKCIKVEIVEIKYKRL